MIVFRSILAHDRARPLALAAMLSLAAWPVLGEELNSERIERRFGSYGVAVLEQSADLRLANLFSVEEGGPICRTFAIVRFGQPLPAALAAPHRAILAGGSIGAVFEQHGWQITKTHLHVGEYAAQTDAGRVAELMRIALPASLAMHVYRLSAARHGAPVDYATIVELHHPDYLTLEALERLYAAPSSSLPPAERARLDELVRRSVAP